MPHPGFLTLPIYRLSRDAYYARREAFVKKYVAKMIPESEINSTDVAATRDFYKKSAIESFGGCWEFNEIFAYVCIFFYGDEVRGSIYRDPKRRMIGSQRKRLAYEGWSTFPCTSRVPHNPTSDQVRSAVEQFIELVRSEFPKRFVETGGFDLIADHMDWRSLFDARIASTQ
jgi:hypothetical protein